MSISSETDLYKINMRSLGTSPRAITWWLPYQSLAVIKFFIFKELTLNMHYSNSNKLTAQHLYTLVIYRIKTFTMSVLSSEHNEVSKFLCFYKLMSSFYFSS